MAQQYWLMKSEPNEFSLEDLQNCSNQTEPWDGVRNYQARNFMRDEMRVRDRVLFYHSGKHPAVNGTARIVKAGYPDHTARDSGSKHFDPKSTPEEPIWFMVDIQFEEEFAPPIPLAELRKISGLKNMILLRKGNRLSVMPVTPKEFNTILSLAKERNA